MYVTKPEQRAGILAAVVTGGRPKLAERKTAKLMDSLVAAGLNDIVWIVSDREAHDYEANDYPLVTYPHEWAFDYAQQHWTDIQLPAPTAKALGPFPGREFACLEAERRGCWAVFMLDDNIIRLCAPRGTGTAAELVRRRGGLGLYCDLLAATALSTNGRMVGAQLQAAINDSKAVARKGFPYSVFIERVGEGREHWHGPFEDDIIHAYQYGSRADGATTVIVPSLRYIKDSQVGGGLRTIYNSTRAVQLQRMFPQSAKISIQKRMANGRGQPRVYHSMATDAIRNPLRVTDPAVFRQVKASIEDLLREWHIAQQQANRDKVARRAAKAGIL